MVTQNRHHGGRIVIDVKGRQEVVHFLSRLAISTFLLYIICSVWLHDLGIGVFALATIIAAVTTPINLRNAKIGLIQFGITTAIAYVCSFWAVAGGINPLICILLGIPMRFPFLIGNIKFHQSKNRDIPYNQLSWDEKRKFLKKTAQEKKEKDGKKIEGYISDINKTKERRERQAKLDREFLQPKP